MEYPVYCLQGNNDNDLIYIYIHYLIKRTDRVIDWLLIFLYNIRHGKDHRFNPTEVNYRANIDAMRQLGVTHILSATACGSLKVSLYGHANKYKACLSCFVIFILLS